MTKPPLPRKPSLEETTKKELSATAGDHGGEAKISPSAQPSPAVERPVAMGERFTEYSDTGFYKPPLLIPNISFVSF